MTERTEALIPDHWAEDPPRRRLCAHADDDGRGMHWLEPGQRCPYGTADN